MDIKKYNQLADHIKPKSHKIRNCINAFVYGGFIGAIGQFILECYMNIYHIDELKAAPMMSITLVLIACLLTGLGYMITLLNMLEQGLLYLLQVLPIV